MLRFTGFALCFILFMRALQAHDRGFVAGAWVIGILAVITLCVTIYQTHKNDTEY